MTTIQANPEPIGRDSLGVPIWGYNLGDRLTPTELTALTRITETLNTEGSQSR